MAVSPAYTFDYEVRVKKSDVGGFAGIAESLQEREGALPGLAGPGPKVVVQGDAMALHARLLPSSNHDVLEAVLSFLPVISNALVDKRLRRASVRRIELSVPGLGSLLSEGNVLRMTLLLDDSGVPRNPPCCTVTLSSDGTPVRTWQELTAELVQL